MVWVVSQTHAHIFQPLDEYKAILRKLIKVWQLLMDLKRQWEARDTIFLVEQSANNDSCLMNADDFSNLYLGV
jgi:hypothetical protein